MKDPERIVIYRLGSLGDTVVALPCFHQIARTWPDAERVLLTNVPVHAVAAPIDAILGPSGLIHRSIAYPVGTRSVTDFYRLWRQLRALRADVLVYVMPVRGWFSLIRDWLFLKCCGFRRIEGLSLSPTLRRARRTRDAESGLDLEERECERLARALAALGPIDTRDPAMWDLHLTPGERAAADELRDDFAGRPFIAINMGGKVAQKDWGAERWRALLSSLADEYPQTGLLIVGAQEDASRAEDVARAWSSTVVNACGQLSPRESAAAMRGALFFVGHDSGPLHVAAAVGVPCIGLFGDFNRPNRWHPIGSQHRILHRLSSLEHLSVREVLAAARDLRRQRVGDEPLSVDNAPLATPPVAPYAAAPLKWSYSG